MGHAESERETSFWGWGWADRFPDRDTRRALGAQAAPLLGFAPERLAEPVRLADVRLPAPRLRVPEALAGFCTDAAEARVRHTWGRSFPDVWRGFHGDFGPAPDLVAFPPDEAALRVALDWAAGAGVAVVPYGGGTSVVGGVEPSVGEGFAGTLSLDLRRFDRVLAVEPSSLSACIQAGATGAALERQLAAEGLTLRCYPQSFEHSTLGGWIATRAGGHFATLYTHIDDLVQSTRLVSPAGVLETRRLPGSGAGPAPDRLVIGSEGTLGVITQAWLRVRPRPTFRATATVRFPALAPAVAGVRALSQSGLHPSNCRLLDAREAALNLVSFDGSAIVVVGFESADHPLEPWLARALELLADHGGRCPDGPRYRTAGPGGGGPAGDDAAGDGALDGAGRWRQAFLEAPYLLNVMVSLGVMVDTFETAVPWDRWEALHARVVREVRAALKETCGHGFLSLRFTHVYPDGPAPYYTFLGPVGDGDAPARWRVVKEAAMRAVVEEGGTITHHHAVGRTHRPWYERERPALFGAALAAVKGALDPAGIMNPGALLPARPPARGAGG